MSELRIAVKRDTPIQGGTGRYNKTQIQDTHVSIAVVVDVVLYLSAVVAPAATPPYRAARKKYKNQYVDLNFFLQAKLCVKQQQQQQKNKGKRKTKKNNNKFEMRTLLCWCSCFIPCKE